MTADETKPRYGLLGKTLIYRLTSADCDEIRARFGQGESVDPTCEPGDRVPMIVTCEHSQTMVNGQVLIDGQGTLWRTSIEAGSDDGQWLFD